MHFKVESKMEMGAYGLTTTREQMISKYNA
jgi:hypothetical protein